MSEYHDTYSKFYNEQPVKRKNNVLINILLFIATFATTVMAGVAWIGKDPYQLLNFPSGILYSVLILTVITFHEFGHYFAARIHKVDVTLPYYIPFPLIFVLSFGTMGAVIRMRDRFFSRKALFDIAVAGPIAGWIVCLIILAVGFLTLPSVDYLYNIHPEYASSGIITTGVTFGKSIIYTLFENIFAREGAFIPPMNEIYHYPWLCVGWFGLLITSLNLMPVGQLDGGHLSYTMFNKKHVIIAYIFFFLILIFGIIGLLSAFGIIPEITLGSTSWLVWVVIIFFLIKIKHPPTIPENDEPLSPLRTAIGWFTYLIFILSFAPSLIYEVS